MTHKHAFSLFASAALLLSGALATSARAADAPAAQKKSAADPLDWTRWRGPEQNGVSREVGLPAEWDPDGGEGSNLLWKREDLGGRSTPIVMRGKLYTIVRDQPDTKMEGEKIVCLDPETGETIWENRFNVYLSDVPDTRVGWSSCVGDPETGKVYALGVCGYFQCLDGETGKTLWSRSLHEEYGLLSTYGGRTNMPVVFDDLVIISAVVIGWDEMAKPAHRFMAFDKATGEIVWFNGTTLFPTDTTYSAPVLTAFNGEPALVFGSGDGRVWAIQPRTGRHIWQYHLSRRGLNNSPLVHDNIVYIGHSEENLEGTTMGGLVAIDGRQHGDITGKHLWFKTEIDVSRSAPLMIDGRLYVLTDQAKLHVFDPKTGEQIARKALGTAQRSSMLYADGKIYVPTNDGRWWTLKPTEDGVEVLHRMRFDRGEAADGSPIVSHGRLYVPTSKALYCVGFKDAKPKATPIPPQPKEAPVASDMTPAQLQVVPCEVLMRPGETQKFTVRKYNARGQLLGTAQATFTVEGPGQISGDGTFTAHAGAAHQAAFVTAKLGDLTAGARVRIVPDLPWKWDFEQGDDLPITWLGGRVRYVLQDLDGERVAMKRDNIPAGPGKFTKLGTRSRAWFGSPNLSNYTVQADFRAGSKNGKLPDMGLINQRYTLELQGEQQRLVALSWDADMRMAEVVPFKWEAGKWYTLKFTTMPQGDKLLVRGKVWPRGEPEPKEWTVEAVDPVPNLQGSPGLFGNSVDAVFYLDNLSVTPDKKK